jgi:glycosyltransferase involved in cell wall biosynthesis
LRGARGLALNVAERKTVLGAALALPDAVIAHSQFLAQVFAQAGLTGPILHIANGHDLGWLAAYHGKTSRPASRGGGSPILRFGYMGQIGFNKGVRVLIDAFLLATSGRATPGRDSAPACLDIWGSLDKTEETAYVAGIRATADQAAGAITLRGPFRRTDIATVLAGIDVLVVPSLWYENAPLVIQEAFATGTPVITTDLGGMAEAVTDGLNGLCFRCGDAAGLAHQMRRLLTEPDLLPRLQNGIPPVKTIDEELTEIQSLYADLIVNRIT